MWSVFRITGSGALEAASSVTGIGRDGLADEVTELSRQAAGKDVVTRGCYDLQGLRADADYMFWWHAPSSDDLQEMYARFRRTAPGPGQRAGLVGHGAAPARGVQQERTSPRSWPRRSPAGTCRCTRSSGPTSGT